MQLCPKANSIILPFCNSIYFLQINILKQICSFVLKSYLMIEVTLGNQVHKEPRQCSATVPCPEHQRTQTVTCISPEVHRLAWITNRRTYRSPKAKPPVLREMHAARKGTRDRLCKTPWSPACPTAVTQPYKQAMQEEGSELGAHPTCCSHHPKTPQQLLLPSPHAPGCSCTEHTTNKAGKSPNIFIVPQITVDSTKFSS